MDHSAQPLHLSDHAEVFKRLRKMQRSPAGLPWLVDPSENSAAFDSTRRSPKTVAERGQK